MKRTRKWAYVAQEAKRLAGLGLSPREIAKRLEVERRSVDRWMAAGKLADTRPISGSRRLPTGLGITKLTKPSEWSATVRKDYALDATDDQMVTLAESALGVALDPLQPASVRLSASGRFQALVKQLALVARSADQPGASPAPTPSDRAERPMPTRRTGGDPRAVLTAVK